MTVGDYIREVREGRGLSKAALARDVGVSWTTVNNWEKHGIKPGNEHFPRLATALKLNSEEKTRLLSFLHDVDLTTAAASEVAQSTSAKRRMSHAVPPQDRASVDALLTRALVPGSHTLVDANAVFEAMIDAAGVIAMLAEPQLAARRWLDAAARLRGRGLPVTAATIAAMASEVDLALPLGQEPGSADPATTIRHKRQG